MPTSASPQQGIYYEQHINRETTMIVDSSNTIRGDGTFNFASGRVTMPGSLARGYINLGAHLFGARVAASGETVASGSSAPTAFWGGLLMPDGTPALKFLSTADPILMLSYASGITTPIALPPISMPQDMSTAGGFTIEIYGETVGTGSASDAADAFKINARYGVGDVEMGSTHPNFSSTPSWQGITLASGNLTTDMLNIILTPQAHAARGWQVYGMRASYAKLTS